MIRVVVAGAAGRMGGHIVRMIRPERDLQVAGATFNDIFRAAHAAAGKVGFKAASDLVINTPEGTIVMMCTGAEQKAHLHIITILAKDGNQALAKVAMHKIAPQAMLQVA